MAGVLLSSCGNVTIKDEVWYGNKGMMGAVAFHTFTTDSHEVSFEDWMRILRNNPLVCTSVTSVGDMKKELEQLCSVCNCCSPDMTAALDQFVTNVAKSQKDP
jgi:hypothetical protein